MTPSPETNSEPSIEEILDSIRQIIADDDEGGGEAAAAPPPMPKPEEKPAPRPAPADDVIELTERVPEPKAAAPPPPPPEPARQAIEVDMKEPEPVAAPPPPPVRAKAPEPPMPAPPPEPMDDLETVITQKAEAAAVKAFSELTQRASIEKGGGVTIEDVVRYEVRPLLRAWIDKYLPSIVERLLQKELEKISRRFEQD